MNWLEVSVTASNEAAEAIAEVLSRYAQHGIAIEAGPEGWNAEPVVVRAYLPADGELEANKRRVQEALWHLGQIVPIPAPTFRPVAESDWAESWKQHLTLLRIGQRIVIRPSWIEYAPAPGEIVIQLDPGMAFGTGLHPTTQMCLIALEESVHPGAKVLDLGTGSAILAIATARLGAGPVLAVDNDPVAVQVARENVKSNNVQEYVQVVQGTLAEATGTYDLVVVNILARTIVEMMQERLATRVCPGGKLIAAGLLLEQEPEVTAALEQAELSLVERRQIDDWVCLVVERA